MTAYQRLLDALINYGSRVNEVASGHDAMAQCPAHDDGRPSLHLQDNGGHVLVYCHAGCTTADILDRIKWSESDLFDNRRDVGYRYTDDTGTTLRTVIRAARKHFRQTGDTSQSTLYRLPQLKAAIARGETVFLVEGEKDVHVIESTGATATTTPGGARNFRHADLGPLHGAHVIAVIDRDETGKAWAQQVAERLASVAASVRFAQARSGKDAADHVMAGHTLADLDHVTVEPVNGHDRLADDHERPPRQIRLTRAAMIKPEPVSWLWEHASYGRIPCNALSIFAGREATGKSTFAAWLTARITTGTLPGTFYGTPRPVAYVSIEESWSQALVPKLAAAGADLDLVHLVDVITDTDEETSIMLPLDNIQLEAVLHEMGGGVMVIDPLMSVISARIDTHRERDVRQALDPLARIADRTATAMLGIAHFSKSSSSDVANLITGSGAFKNVARAVFGFAEDDGERIMSQVKNSLGVNDLSVNYEIVPTFVDSDHGQLETVRFHIAGISDRHVSDILRQHVTDDDDRDERDAAIDWLRWYLESQGGAEDRKQILKAGKAAGFSEPTLKRARSKAGIKADRRGFPGRGESGSVWVLPETITDAETAADDRSAHAQPARLKEPDPEPSEPSGDPSGEDHEPVKTTALVDHVANNGTEWTRDRPELEDNQDRPRCRICGEPLSDQTITAGYLTHPSCDME